MLQNKEDCMFARVNCLQVRGGGGTPNSEHNAICFLVKLHKSGDVLRKSSALSPFYEFTSIEVLIS